MKRLLLIAVLSLLYVTGRACTNLIVGKTASADGSVICTYNCDGYGGYGTLTITHAGNFPKGTMMPLRSWWGNKAVPDSIPQASHIYNVVGNMNECQVTITETTTDGRKELIDETGLLSYPQVMQLGLQRASTAREAIKIMAELMDKYGYNSEGENFSVCDPNEAWVMELFGKGKGGHGAVWVAIRIPDDCVCAYANQARIGKIPFSDKKNCMYSKDVVKFAREKGYYKGSDKDFVFCDAYCPLDFKGCRYCEARVWSFFNRCNPEMKKYLPLITGESNERMPLYIKPTHKLSVQDIQNAMRDHYEGTPLDITKDYSWGPYGCPNRPAPYQYEVNGKKYFQERPTGTVQSAFTLVAQMRSWLPNHIGGVQWFGCDDANMVAYVPMYCCTTDTPECFQRGVGSDTRFSFKSAFWMCNWVANMVYPRYNLLIDDFRYYQSNLENGFHNRQDSIESIAKTLYAESPAKAQKFLNDYSQQSAQLMMDRWMTLAQFLIVKYNDFKVRDSKDGAIIEGRGHLKDIQLPKEFLEMMVKETGDRYLMPNIQ